MNQIDALKKLLGSRAVATEVKKAAQPVSQPRTVGDIYAMIEAQRIYNPNQPSVPNPKAPSQGMNDQGTTPAMDTSGAWGTPSE